MFYVLEEHTPVPATPEHWGLMFSKSDRQVARDEIGRVVVSTVFLGIDHNFDSGGPPLLFETMIFGGKHDEFQERYATWEEAEAGHARALKLAGEV